MRYDCTIDGDERERPPAPPPPTDSDKIKGGVPPRGAGR